MKNAWSTFRNNFDATREDESGDIVQTILIIAVFVVIVVVVGNILYTEIEKRSKSTAACINGVGTTGGAAGGVSSGCN